MHPLYNERFFDTKDSKEAVTLGMLPPLTIRPSRGWVSLRLKDLWEYRELLYFLVWRDMKVRYKQTAFYDNGCIQHLLWKVG